MAVTFALKPSLIPEFSVPANLCPTPSFVGGVGLWTTLAEGTGASATIEPSSARHGAHTSHSLLVKATFGTSGSSQAGVDLGYGGSNYKLIPVQSGGRYYVGAWVNVIKNPVGISFSITWFTAAGVVISTQASRIFSTGEHTFSFSAEAPHNAAYMGLRLGEESTSGQEMEAYLDEVFVRTSAAEYCDGSQSKFCWSGTPWNSVTNEVTLQGELAYKNGRLTYKLSDHLVGIEIPNVEDEFIVQGLRDLRIFEEH